MAILRRVQGAEERMDAPDVDVAELERALRDVARVNRWLGGRRALRRHLPWALGSGGSRILDVGTGSGDLPRTVAAWARRQRCTASIIALDRHPATLRVARRACRDEEAIEVVGGDALRLPFRTGAFDLVLLSMTLHHMEGEAQVGVLRELARVAHGGRILVGELERSLPNYLGARLLAATLWRRSRITRHDGPLSVLRSFTAGELLELAQRAGLGRPVVYRHPFYRLVLRAEA